MSKIEVEIVGKAPSDAILVCKLVAELSVPPVQSFVESCSDCNRAIWIALSSPAHQAHVCTRCLTRRIDGKNPKLLVTESQLRDYENDR